MRALLSIQLNRAGCALQGCMNKTLSVQQSNLRVSTSSLLQDLENKVKFLVTWKKKKGSGLKENYKHDRMSCRQSKQFLFSFHQKRKDALGNATCKQVGSAKISRKPLEHSCLFEAKQLEEYFFKLYYMKINRIFLLPFIRSANIYSTVTVADSAGCSGITNIVPSLVELGSLTCFSVAGYAWERTVLKYFLEEETFKKWCAIYC